MTSDEAWGRSQRDLDDFMKQVERQLIRDYGWIPVWLGVAMIEAGVAGNDLERWRE